MSYAAAIDRLLALGHELHTPPNAARRKFELAHIRALLEAVGNPQNTFASILIAGTNGKGSTSATLASVLHQAGYSTGLYTSPHLSRVNERICVDGRAIEDSAFAAFFFAAEEAAGRLVAEGQLPALPSFFEILTAIAFLHFARSKIHTAVLEVGMGGRLDATNVVDPVISLITDISLDHMEWLGPTVGAIAHEKAGILRPGGIMVTLPQHPEANQALGEAAMALSVRGVDAARYVPGRSAPELRNRYTVALPEGSIEVDSPLTGAHQQRNLALAIAAAVELRNNHSYNIPDHSIEQGIRATIWPARLEAISVPGGTTVLLDVAHNPAGAWALREAVSHWDDAARKTLVFGCLRDKQVTDLARILFPLFEKVVVTPVASPRSATAEELLEAARATGADAEAATSAEAALERALSLTPGPGLVVVAGSIYLAGALRDRILGAAPKAEKEQAR